MNPCALSTAATPEDPCFQPYQFDKRLDGITKRMEDSGVFDVLDRDEVFASGRGFRIFAVDLKQRELPEWARTKKGVQQILLTAFPKLHTNRLQRQRAGRWAQVIELFYWNSWTDSEVAEELGESKVAVKSILRSIARTAAGKTANGSRVRKQHDESCHAQAA